MESQNHLVFLTSSTEIENEISKLFLIATGKVFLIYIVNVFETLSQINHFSINLSILLLYKLYYKLIGFLRITQLNVSKMIVQNVLRYEQATLVFLCLFVQLNTDNSILYQLLWNFICQYVNIMNNLRSRDLLTTITIIYSTPYSVQLIFVVVHTFSAIFFSVTPCFSYY